MPIYEYECTECSHRIEALQRLSEPPLSDCPVCGKPALRKLVSAPSFRLKGGGWYETDFKTGDKKYLAGDKANDKKGTDGANAKSDSAGQAKEKSGTKAGGTVDAAAGGAKKS